MSSLDDAARQEEAYIITEIELHHLIQAGCNLAGVALEKGATVKPYQPCGLDEVMDMLGLKEMILEAREQNATLDS